MDRIDDELDQLQITTRCSRSANRTRSLSRGFSKRRTRKWSVFGKPRSLSKSKESSCSDSGLAVSLGSSSTGLQHTDELIKSGTSRQSRTKFKKSSHLGDTALNGSTGLSGSGSSTYNDQSELSRQTNLDPPFLFPITKHMNSHPSFLASAGLHQRVSLLDAPITLPDTEELGSADGASVQSVDTPRTEDFEAAFQDNLVKQVAGAPVVGCLSLESDSDTVNTDFVRDKIQQAAPEVEDIISTAGIDTMETMSDLERHRSSKPSYLSNGHGQNYDASSESETDREMVREIREESVRIQKEMELERKARRNKEASSTSALMTPKSREKTPASSDTTPNGSDRQYSASSSRYATGSNSGTPTNATTVSQVSIPSLSVNSSHANTHTGDAEMIERLNNEKLRLLREISVLQGKMRNMEEELSTSERKAKDTRVRVEEARSQMLLAEFKKDSALKEFTELSSELERGRQLRADIQLESAQRIPVTAQGPVGNSFGLSSAELSDLLSERNQLRTIVESRNSSVQLEKAEIERQLNDTKQELFSEQRANRDRLAGLENKMEDLMAQLSQVNTEKETKALELDAFRSKNHKLEQSLRELEKSKLEAIMERDKEIEVLKETSQRDVLEIKMKLNNDLNNSNRLLKIAEEKCLKLQVEIEHRENLNQDLREECNLLQSRTVDEEESHDQMIREMTRRLAALQEQKQSELEVLKSQMEIENLNMVETTNTELQRQHEELIASLKEDYDSQLNQQQHLLNGKDEEICLLRSRLTQQEEAGRKLTERLKADTRIQLEQAVQNERYMWEKEQRHVEGETLKQCKEEADKQHEQLREQIDIEQRRCRQLDDQYRALKSELEEQRHQNQKLYEEKLAAVGKSKQAAQEETNIQLEKIRQQLEEDTERVLDKLRSELTMREDEIRELKNEVSDLQQQDSDSCIALEKLEKLVVSEINDECRKTAHLLGLTPRKAQGAGFRHSSSPSRSGKGKRRRTKSVTTSAIANLRACNEEMRNAVKELKEDVEALKSALYKAKKSKETELEEIKKQMSRAKGHDMDDLRVRLTQEHKAQIDHICAMVGEHEKLSKLVNSRDRELKDIRQNMRSWKDETANKMADKFTDELHNQLKVYLSRLERKLADKTLHRSLRDSAKKTQSADRQQSGNLAMDDLGASPPLRQSVQSRIRQLRSRSSSAHRATSLSTPDLSLAAESASTALEQRVKLAELKAHLAEERAARNQALLNHKLQEVNQLQHTLNSQTKDLLSLERSFEDLKQVSYSPPGLASHHMMT
ncbi:interaptin-like [Watersipora subatra]|uniref:interaptin-like n=1 Tax=Watersipora subatra TaxID=2589382 RepID=UPI00355C1D1A